MTSTSPRSYLGSTPPVGTIHGDAHACALAIKERARTIAHYGHGDCFVGVVNDKVYATGTRRKFAANCPPAQTVGTYTVDAKATDIADDLRAWIGEQRNAA